MLKISEIPPSNHTVTLRLEGRVVGPWVVELRESCEKLLSNGRVLNLRLAEVEFLDASGINLLMQLRKRGVRLLDCAPFVEAQLKSAVNS
jgi:anti-anti-sigma regulatory factor